MECLQGIAEGRTSESLQTQAAVEASKENISLRDIRGAYKDFGFEFRSPFLDDDVIIGAFQSRVSDAPKQETQLRRALRIIGQDRSSNKIQQVASNGRWVLTLFSRVTFRNHVHLLNHPSCVKLRASLIMVSCY